MFVHRCRFIDYTPSPITALALSDTTLAVGHANGNIDLAVWTGDYQAWTTTTTLVGLYPSKIDNLVFANSRLFSSGGGSDLLEWDLQGGFIKRTLASQGGTIWSMAVSPSSDYLALGCEDAIRILSLKDGQLAHIRRFDRVKSRILSIAWGSGEWIVSGGSDSTLRKWDCKTGRILDRMTTDKVRGERTLVWAVSVLPDGTIVSGDSLGTLKLFSSQTCTQRESFQGHAADILALATSPDGNTIYSAGVDQKITQYAFVGRKWIQTTSRRLHSHDIRALLLTQRGDVPILISGGLDMSLVLTPASATQLQKLDNPLRTSTDITFGESYHRRVAYPVFGSAVAISKGARLVSCILGERGVGVWSIPPKSEEQERPYSKLVDITLNVQTNLVASALSDDGRWLAVSDVEECRLFELVKNGNGTPEPKRIKSFHSSISSSLPAKAAASGTSALAFTPDSTKLVMGLAKSSYILIVDLGDGGEVKVLRRFEQHRDRAGRVVKGRGAEEDVVMSPSPSESSSDSDSDSDSEIIDYRPHRSSPPKHLPTLHIHLLTISSDGQWLLSSDISCKTHIFNLDSITHHSALPTFPLKVQGAAFHLDSTGVTLGFRDNTTQVYDVEGRSFAPTPGSGGGRLEKLHDSAVGVSCDPAGGEAIVWGSTWVARASASTHAASGKKRRRDVGSQAQARDETAPVITQYRPIIHLGFIGPGEMVVVERPLTDVLAGLHQAYAGKKYGAS